jgi:hypothetical protein
MDEGFSDTQKKKHCETWVVNEGFSHQKNHCEIPLWAIIILGQKGKGFLSWACFFYYCSQFLHKRNYYIILTPQKTWESWGGAQKANQKKKKSLLLLLELIFVPNSCTNEYWNNMARVSWSSSAEWSAHTLENGVWRMAYAHKRDPYNDTEHAGHVERSVHELLCYSSSVFKRSTVHRTSTLHLLSMYFMCYFGSHCIAVFITNWVILQTSIIGHNIYVIFIALRNNCWVFRMLLNKNSFIY